MERIESVTNLTDALPFQDAGTSSIPSSVKLWDSGHTPKQEYLLIYRVLMYARIKHIILTTVIDYTNYHIFSIPSFLQYFFFVITQVALIRKMKSHDFVV